ncbi:MAG: transposase [Actinobacteria bacterium]|nr:transposase [Actinomycetota bacterium]
MMVALLLSGYCQGERSSRVIEKRCVRDVGYRVITGGLRPDHATIARFRARHETALGGLFSQVLRVLAAEGMVSLGTLDTSGQQLTEAGIRPTLRTVLADAGYVSEDNFARAGNDKLPLLAPLAKDPARPGGRSPKRARHLDQYRPPPALSAASGIPADGRTTGCGPAPWNQCSGSSKPCQKLSMMSRRGLAACESEWLLARPAHNLRKPHRHRAGG